MDKPATARRGANLPEGVEVRAGARGERLRVCFTWLGERRRETLNIPATPKNITYAGRLRAEVMNAIERGTFNYAEMFPDSKYVKATSRKTVKQPTIGELITDYIDTARKTKSLSPSTIVSYLRWANHRLIPQWGNHLAADITPLQLTQWIADLSTELTPKSVRNCVGLLSAVLNRAAGYGIIKTNPLAPIKLRNFLPKRSRSDDDDIDPVDIPD